MFMQNGKHITQDSCVLLSVKGYRIPFMQKPYQWRTRSPREEQLMLGAIKDLMAKGAVVQVEPVENQFTSTIFLVEKENGNGQYRPVIKASCTSSVACHLACRQPYERQPYKILKPIAALLRSLGVRVVFYLDDILLLHQNKDELWKIFQQVVDLLQNLGFKVKREKCSALPTQQLIFLEKLSSQEKLSAITMTAMEILQSQETYFRTLSTLSGRMNHASQTGLWMAPLYYRSLQRDQIKALHSASNPSQLMKITLSPASIEELCWWTSLNIQTFNGQLLRT